MTKHHRVKKWELKHFWTLSRVHPSICQQTGQTSSSMASYNQLVSWILPASVAVSYSPRYIQAKYPWSCPKYTRNWNLVDWSLQRFSESPPMAEMFSKRVECHQFMWAHSHKPSPPILPSLLTERHQSFLPFLEWTSLLYRHYTKSQMKILRVSLPKRNCQNLWKSLVVAGMVLVEVESWHSEIQSQFETHQESWASVQSRRENDELKWGFLWA